MAYVRVLTVAGAIALNGEPPVYIDAGAGLIGEVALPLAPKLRPPVAERAVHPARPRRVGIQRPGAASAGGAGLLPRPPEPVTKIHEDPVPVVHLSLGKTGVYGYYGYADTRPVAVASLSFRYGPLTVEPGETRTLVEGFSDGRMWEATRRPGLEKAAVSQLIDCDMVPAQRVYTFLDARPP